MIIQWAIALFITGYGFAALNEEVTEHPIQLLCGPLGLLMLASMAGML